LSYEGLLAWPRPESEV